MSDTVTRLRAFAGQSIHDQLPELLPDDCNAAELHAARVGMLYGLAFALERHRDPLMPEADAAANAGELAAVVLLELVEAKPG